MLLSLSSANMWALISLGTGAAFSYSVVGAALLTFFAWGLFGPQPSWVYGLITAVTVLIIACPCTLGLATPMSIMVATGNVAHTEFG